MYEGLPSSAINGTENTVYVYAGLPQLSMVLRIGVYAGIPSSEINSTDNICIRRTTSVVNGTDHAYMCATQDYLSCQWH